MISDDERRDVARRLRGIKDTRDGCGSELCCDLWSAIFECGYRCTGLCDECEVAVLDSLADLIEPAQVGSGNPPKSRNKLFPTYEFNALTGKGRYVENTNDY